jgi:hypothetical protein
MIRFRECSIFELYKYRHSIKILHVIFWLLLRLLRVVFLREEHRDANGGKDHSVREAQVSNVWAF